MQKISFAETQNDTIKIDIHQAEQIFLEKNLQLLAAKFNINASKALEIQAGLWNNPTFNIEQSVYNKLTGKYFDFTQTGNTDLGIDQLISLAGKKNKQVALAQINTKISENTFFDLMRTLKFELRKNFYQLYFSQRSLKFYDETIPILQKTISSSVTGYEKKFVLLSEVIRLKSLLLSLENERLSLQNQISDLTNQLSLLLRLDQSNKITLMPQIITNDTETQNLDKITLDEAVETAKENRPDYKISKLNVDYESANLSLQKSLAIPDVTIGGRYSRNAGYVPDYLGLTVQVDLPIFNRNQGNIEASEHNLNANKLNSEHALLSLITDVKSAYEKAASTDRFYKNIDKKFTTEYKNLVEAVSGNYQKRNIGIIEFTDFLESYRNSMVQMNQLQNDRLTAFEELNFVTGKSLLNN